VLVSRERWPRARVTVSSLQRAGFTQGSPQRRLLSAVAVIFRPSLAGSWATPSRCRTVAASCATRRVHIEWIQAAAQSGEAAAHSSSPVLLRRDVGGHGEWVCKFDPTIDTLAS